MNPRRHDWKSVDPTHAKCSGCGARTRVVLSITDAGLRAVVERHGPSKCTGNAWGGRAGWWGYGKEPPAPWEKKAHRSDKDLSRPTRGLSGRYNAPGAPSDRSDNAPGGGRS